MHLERQDDEKIRSLGALRRYAGALGFDVRVVLIVRRDPKAEQEQESAA